MTDNKIIGALERCFIYKNCNGCPQEGEKQCLESASLGALDLINRQKAENSNLTSRLTSLQNDLTSAKAEIEKREKHIDELNDQIEHLVFANDDADAEIERYKQALRNAEQYCHSLVKEMGGEG